MRFDAAAEESLQWTRERRQYRQAVDIVSTKTSIEGNLKNCTLDDLKLFCTCESNQPIIEKRALYEATETHVYMIAIVNNCEHGDL